MDIKIGKYILLLQCLIASYVLGDKIELKLTDVNDNIVKRAGKGEALTLKVKVEGSFDTKNLEIPGLDEFSTEPRGTYKRVVSFNGKTTYSVEHVYSIRPKKIGRFKIGPVTLTNKDGTVSSNEISIKVRLKPKLHERASQKNNEDAEVFLEFFPERERAVVGERIPIIIRLNASSAIEMEQLIIPQVSDSVYIEQPETVKDGSKIINGKTFTFREWKSSVIVNEPGSFTIPEVTCVYEEPLSANWQSVFLSNALLRMGLGRNSKRTSSSSFQIFVDPILSDMPIHGVGVFKEFSVHLDRNHASKGEGLILRLQITGDEIEGVKPLDLELPENLRSYASKEEVSRQRREKMKSFEYVIQGLEQGVYTVPTQIFRFYNTTTRAVEELKSMPISLKITEGLSPAMQNVQKVGEKFEIDEDEICPFNEEGPWSSSIDYSISWPWFILLALLPLVAIFFHVASLLYTSYCIKYKDYFDSRDLFNHGRRVLKSLKKHEDVAGLYDLFIGIFSQQCLPLTVLSDEKIASILKESGFSRKAIEQWLRFWKEVNEYSWAAKPTAQKDELFKRAAVWLDQLEEKL